MAGEREFTVHGEGRQLFRWMEGTLKAPVEAIFEGPAGTGKSRTVGEFVDTFCRAYPKCSVLFLRKTRVSLSGSFLKTWERDVLGEDHPMVLGGPTREHRNVYRYENGSEIVVGGMDNETRLFSTEFNLVFVNECQELTLEEWESLHRSLRRPGTPFRLLLGDCNPASEYHWANQRACDGGDHNGKPCPEKLHRIRGKFTDNPTITEEYLNRLRNSLTGYRYERLFLGRWVAAEGIVYQEYDPGKHLITGELEHESDTDTHWLHVAGRDPIEMTCFFGSQDIGYEDPGVAQLWGMDKDDRMYRLSEVYYTHKVHDWWASLWEEWAFKYPIRAIACDHDPAFIENLNRRFTRRFGRHMGHLARMADKSRGLNGELAGINDVQERFMSRSDGTYGLYLVRDSFPKGKDVQLKADKKPTCTEEEILSYVYEKRLADKKYTERPDPTCVDHGCFPEGTLVATPWGHADITLLRPGDKVLTPDGEGTVTDWGMTGVKPLVEIELETGEVLSGTADHPMWCEGRWVPLRLLIPGDTLAVWQESRRGSTEGRRTGDTQTRQDGLTRTTSEPQPVAATCTDTSTRTSTGRYLPGIRYTTETGIPATMLRRISSPYRQPITRRSIRLRESDWSDPAITWFEYVPSPLPGTAHRKDEPGIASTPRTAASVIRYGKRRSASDAATFSTGSGKAVSAPTLASQPGGGHPESMTLTGSVATAAKDSGSTSTRRSAIVLSRVLAIREKRNAVPVYDITVDDQHVFFANGVLAGNCDSLRYACRWAKNKSFPGGKNVDKYPPGSYGAELFKSKGGWDAILRGKNRRRRA